MRISFGAAVLFKNEMNVKRNDEKQVSGKIWRKERERERVDIFRNLQLKGSVNPFNEYIDRTVSIVRYMQIIIR